MKTVRAIKLSSPATREFWEIPVLFEDDHLLALDKPAGLSASPDRSDPQRPNLLKLLHAAIADGRPWTRERNLVYLANAHRLDAETSGVFLLAKDRATLLALANLFGSEKPLKKCLALVRGAPGENKFTLDARLAPHPMKMGLMCVDPKNGKKSRTEFEVLENFSGWTLLRCTPLTDRKHQIRAHLRHMDLPVAGDTLYGGKPLWLSRLKRDFRLKPGREERPLISRPALHVEELTLPHPVTREMLTITAPWPKDFKVAAKYLRQFAIAGFEPALATGT
ncbi:MAG TPA: pseudouridine synthase [Verrucomicrobiae bacterium]|nr:pseudouridine synthase [Verrucomicrobiae bacterium]